MLKFQALHCVRDWAKVKVCGVKDPFITNLGLVTYPLQDIQMTSHIFWHPALTWSYRAKSESALRPVAVEVYSLDVVWLNNTDRDDILKFHKILIQCREYSISSPFLHVDSPKQDGPCESSAAEDSEIYMLFLKLVELAFNLLRAHLVTILECCPPIQSDSIFPYSVYWNCPSYLPSG